MKEAEINILKNTIARIEARNDRVTADKAWETSRARRAFIALCTYFTVWAWLAAIGVEGAALNALVPAGAYLISTLTMPFAKRAWVINIYSKKGELKWH